ncbi:hypothetical protein [Megamonas hypermegale]|uniref:hypothetical protein n=1 Tax=Megamonas hypermegale TaxID=158847 RepID=UPI00242B96C2|nr:hypothetical protein [Megamonas hypermegale]
MISDEMMTNDTLKPYFMKNKKWYYFDEENFCYKLDEENFCYKLTDRAPRKAIESYRKFYDDELIKINGEWHIIQK